MRVQDQKVETKVKPTWHHLAGKSIGLNQKTRLKRGAHGLKNLDAS
jgi:hypothetical protein